MTIKAYSFAQKKKVAMVKGFVMKQYILPNNRTVTILTGKTKKNDKVSLIVSNTLEKECKDGKKRTKKGAKCPRKRT